MKTYTILKTMVLAAVVLINCGAGCSSEKDDPKAEGDTYKLMLGTWKLDRITTRQEQSNGTYKNSSNYAKDRTIDVVWEFEKNGGFTSHDNKGNRQTGNWSLKVQKSTANYIDEGILTLTGSWTKEIAQVFGKEKLEYIITQGEDGGKLYFIALIQSKDFTDDKLNTIIEYQYIKQ